MAQYFKPGVRVFQRPTAAPTSTQRRQQPHVAGGHAHLSRFTAADERELSRLGYYDPDLDAAYPWPHRPAGAKVDQAYTRVFVRDALLKYFDDGAASGGSITRAAGYSNRVRAASTNFVGNGADFPRDALLYDRDVQPGDVVKVRGVDADTGDPVTLWTNVLRVVPDVVDPVVGDVSADADNVEGSIVAGTTTVTRLAGPINCVGLTADVAHYDGLADGDVRETYDVVVVEGSFGGDPTTATLRLISASGHDDASGVVPAAYGVAFAAGSRGLKLTLNENDAPACSASASDSGVGPNDLVEGMRWRVALLMHYVPPVPAAGGDYSGTESTTYVVEVTKGGAYSASPQVTVTTTTGTDASGPTAVAIGDAVTIGSRGLTFLFDDGDGLRKGDKWYLPVTGQSSGAYKTLVLAKNLADGIAAHTELDLSLYIHKAELEVPRNREGYAPEVNFATSATEVTLKSGVLVYDPTWTDGGVPRSLPLASAAAAGYGVAYAHYRAWLPEHVGRLGQTSLATLETDVSGPIHPDNPLKYGLFKALTNSAGVPAWFSAVADPDVLEDWADMLQLCVGRPGLYNMAPLTYDPAVLDLYVAHDAAMSSPDNNLFRAAWFALQGLRTVPVVSAGGVVPGHTAATTSDGATCLCTVTDDPATAGTQYTRVVCPAGNGNFVANGVRPGDVVRTLFTTDGFGNEAYSTFVVDSVPSEDELLLAAGPAAAVNVATKLEVWRALTADEEAAAIGRVAGAYADWRVVTLWPEDSQADGLTVPGYFLAAAYAGAASGVLPQQSLLRFAIAGFTGVSGTDRFNLLQRNVMSAAGVWVVEQADDGTIYCRDATTTVGFGDETLRNEAVRRNVDSVCFRFADLYEPLIGKVNVTPDVEVRLDLDAKALVERLKLENATADLSGQLLGGTTAVVTRHPLARDQFDLALDAVLPYALRNMNIYMTF